MKYEINNCSLDVILSSLAMKQNATFVICTKNYRIKFSLGYSLFYKTFPKPSLLMHYISVRFYEMGFFIRQRSFTPQIFVKIIKEEKWFFLVVGPLRV